MVNKYKHVPMHVTPLDEKWFKGVCPDARKHLLSSLRSLEAGQAPVISFKLYGKFDESVALDFLKSIETSGLKLPEWMLEYEHSRLAKWGQQGGHAPWSELKEDFLLYYSRPVQVSDEYEALLDPAVREKYADLYCKLLGINDTLATLIANEKISDRAAGWRRFDLKKTDRLAQRTAVFDARSGIWRFFWNYVFSRFNKKKKRIFFVVAYCDMILEARWYVPFLMKIQNSLRTLGKKSPFVFWADKIGFDNQFKIVDEIVQDNHIHNLVFIQRDFEKMDTTTGFSQTIHGLYPKLLKAFGIKATSQLGQELADLLYLGSIAPVATPDGMYVGSHGKPSGAETTNGDETADNEDYDDIFQFLLRTKCAEKKIGFKLVYSGGNGDDGTSIYDLYDLKDLGNFKKLISESADEAALICGYRVQGDKWFVSTDYGLYCQNMYYADETGHIKYCYPATLILNSICNPEHQYAKADWDKDFRDLDIIEKLDNGKNLPYFHQLVDYVDNGMKYRLLGRSEKETRRILDKWSKYRALRPERFNRQEYEIVDISESPTVKYLLSKRNGSFPK